MQFDSDSVSFVDQEDTQTNLQVLSMEKQRKVTRGEKVSISVGVPIK